jgi:hypothetical protein
MNKDFHLYHISSLSLVELYEEIRKTGGDVRLSDI